ncbi:MAG: hypothetical protein AMS14_02905 [Planctomycetes bacterium DG_20]|nr:MAG: hypothetical protein AMS14_02905 [Planctomycetes bacterium DG_20]
MRKAGAFLSIVLPVASAVGVSAAGLGPIKTVKVGANRELRVDGRPFFPLMLWLQSDARIPDGLSIAVNTFCGNGGKLSNKAYLDKLAANGLYGVVHFDEAAIGHPHLLGWIHGDEPDLPTQKSRAQVVPAPGLRINRRTPLWRILDGVTHSWSVLDPMAGAKVTFKLPDPVTADSLGVWLTISKGLAVAKEVVFLGDGKQILTATLASKKGRQKLPLAAPATFRELTLQVVSAYPGEQVWGSIGEIQAYDKAGRNLILSKPYTVPRSSVEEVAAVYRKIKAADPTRPVFVTFTAYFMKAFPDKYDPATKDRLYPGYVKSCDVAGYDIYPIFGWSKPQWLGRVADGVTELRAIAGRRPLYAWIETNVGSRWVSPSRQKPLEPRHTRAEVWMAIIRGATAIGYFTHRWQPDYRQFAPTPEMRKELKRLNGQITRLAAAILAAPAAQKIEMKMSDGLACHVKATQLDRALYLFAQNMDLERRGTATISVDGLKAGTTVEVVDESRRLTSQAGRFTDTFGPLAEHIYRIQP